MRMKYLIKCLMLPLLVASLCTACRSEAPTTKVADRAHARPRQFIKLNLTTDITFPTADLKSGSSQPRLYDSGSFIELIESEMAKKLRVNFGDNTNFNTKIYLRKLNDDGTPSTDPKDIFSIVLGKGDYLEGIFDDKTGKFILKGGPNDSEPPIPFTAEVYVNETEWQHHPDRYYPVRHYPFPAYKDENGQPIPIPQKNLPKVGERWQAAAIICFGDQDEMQDTNSRPTTLIDRLDLNDPENAPFTEDAIWLLRPRTECLLYKDWNSYHTEIPVKEGESTMDIPYCADWTDVTVTGDAMLSIHLHAKPIATILHYVLHSIDDPTPQPETTAAALPSAMRAVRGGHRQAFRSNSGIEPDPYSNADNLSTDMGTFYGALYYDQHGDKVHWKRGKWIANYHAADGASADYNRIPAQFRRGLDVMDYLPLAFDDTNRYPWIHLFYCLMPPYDGESAGTHAPRFWLTEKDLKAGKVEDADAAKNYGMNDKNAPEYYLKRGNDGTWAPEYQSPITGLKPGHFHSVYLRLSKGTPPSE